MPPYVDHRVNWKSRHKIKTKERHKLQCKVSQSFKCQNMIVLKLYMALKCLCLLTCMSLIMHDTNRYWCFIASVYEDWESALGMIGWYQFYWCVIYGFFREVKEHCNEYRCEPDVGSADMLQLSGERPYGQVRIENLVPFLQPNSQGLHGSKEGKGQLWADMLQLPGIRAHGQV